MIKILISLLIGATLILSACTTATPTAGNIPETGDGTLEPGGDFTVIPPTEAATQDGGAVATQTPQSGGGQGDSPGSGAGTADPDDSATPGGVSGIPMEDPQPTIGPDVGDGSQASLTYPFLVQELSEEGAVIEEVGESQEPLFGVRGRLIQIDGADATVFEFPSEISRRDAWNTILATGGMIDSLNLGENVAVNFFGSGKVILVYPGSDPVILDQLDSVLVDRFPSDSGGTTNGSDLPQDTADRMLGRLGDVLGVPIDQIRIIDVSAQEWQDSCLGLGQPNESCLQVITPGYSLTVEAGGQRYNVRTNQDGSLVRWTQEQ
jgi:hypothetical protein